MGGTTGKDRVAAAVEEAWFAFDRQLRQKGAYPVDLFKAFFEKATLYAEATKVDALIHRAVVAHVSGCASISSWSASASLGRCWRTPIDSRASSSLDTIHILRETSRPDCKGDAAPAPSGR
jgi:hypothetical protein